MVLGAMDHAVASHAPHQLLLASIAVGELGSVRPLHLDDPPTATFSNKDCEHPIDFCYDGATSRDGEVHIGGAPANAIAHRRDLHSVVDFDLCVHVSEYALYHGATDHPLARCA